MAEGVEVKVMAGVDLTTDGEKAGGVPVMVKMVPSNGTDRTTSDICCIVDVSGSMGAEAELKTETGATTGHGLSVLDVVKHALKTIIKNMGDNDRLALVAYSNDASTVFDLTKMDASGKATTEARLEDLQPNGMTNLWDGLKNGFELLKKGSEKGRLQHVMLFTDGLPNINPPRGILPMLKKLKDKDGGKLCCSINTFGFGYELDSLLLSQLAIDGLGTYAFIPDAGYVGTVFVNSMSNLLSTMARDIVVKLEALNGATFVGTGVLGGHPASQQSDTSICVTLGSIQYGQSRDLVLMMSVPPGAVDKGYLSVTLEFVTTNGPSGTPTATGSGRGNPEEFPVVDQHFLRSRFVDCVREIMKVVTLSPIDRAHGKKLPLPEAQGMVQDLANEMSQDQRSSVCQEEPLSTLLEDVQGQVCEAVSREEWYTKWGVHYLPSLMFAHLSQQCNNFKDAGVQGYGGDLFQSIRDKADEIFLALPPPKPSVRRPPPATASSNTYTATGGFGAAPLGAYSPPSPVNMSAFYDRCAG